MLLNILIMIKKHFSAVDQKIKKTTFEVNSSANYVSRYAVDLISVIISVCKSSQGDV